MKLSVKAPAKINLALDVLKKREDGYHEVKMVMTTIDLADRLDITLLEEDEIRVESSSGIIPDDKRNLAYKAAELLKERFQIKQGCKIEITKNIPVAAGLAGGSSDCAAALKGLNELWNLGLTKAQLAELGSELGSDVAFCVYGGTALATGRGEKITPIASPVPAWVILAKPPLGISTANTYQQVNVKTCEHPNVDLMIEALEEQNYEKMCQHLGNSLESVILENYPIVKKIKEKMKKLGADGVLMSGSGPTVFGLTRYDTRMKRILNGLRGFCKDVYAVRLLG
mgnify:CR=1 FL=1